jgi:hypothetical protein
VTAVRASGEIVQNRFDKRGAGGPRCRGGGAGDRRGVFGGCGVSAAVYCRHAGTRSYPHRSDGRLPGGQGGRRSRRVMKRCAWSSAGTRRWRPGQGAIWSPTIRTAMWPARRGWTCTALAVTHAERSTSAPWTAIHWPRSGTWCLGCGARGVQDRHRCPCLPACTRARGDQKLSEHGEATIGTIADAQLGYLSRSTYARQVDRHGPTLTLRSRKPPNNSASRTPRG